MKSKCFDCPRTKEYIDLGGCPNCRAKKLFMSTKTHMATCDVCGVTFGIPMAIEGLCYEDERYKQYAVSIDAKLNKEQMLDFSKLLGINGVQTYQLFKNNTTVVIEKVPMVLTYQIQSFIRSIGASVSIQLEIDEYHMFEECWKIR